MANRRNKTKTNNVYRMLRISMDLSVDELANKLGISRSYIFAIENKDIEPSKKIIKLYSNFFGINRNALIDLQKNKDSKTFPRLMLDILNEIVN